MAFARGPLVLGAAAALAACSSGGDGGSGSQSSQAPGSGSGAASATRASCAIGGSQAFADACTLEYARVEGAPILVIRHADGGFRRFAVLKDGGLAEADGAQQAVVTRSGTTLEVAVGADRYRLNASQLGNAQ